MILVALVYVIVAIQALLVLPKYFVQSVPLVSTQSGRILQASVVASIVTLMAASTVNNRMSFLMTAMAAAAVTFILIAIYLGRIKTQAFMSNLGPNGTFTPVIKQDGTPFMLWDDKLIQVLYYFSIVLAVLMLLGIVMSMLNIMAEYDMCQQMTQMAPVRVAEPMMRRGIASALGTSNE
jgi:hypothetical protein